MQVDLAAHHRLLAVAYRRYVYADLRLEAALNEMRSFFPPESMPYRGTLGTPRSRIRRLREERDRALLRLQSAHAKLTKAKARARQRQTIRRTTLLLWYRGC